jgi:hypothetical protein
MTNGEGGTDPAAARPSPVTMTREEGSKVGCGGSRAGRDRCPRGRIQRGRVEGGWGPTARPKVQEWAIATAALGERGGGSDDQEGGGAEVGGETCRSPVLVEVNCCYSIRNVSRPIHAKSNLLNP